MYQLSGNKDAEAVELREALRLDPSNAPVKRRLEAIGKS
jgi:hypothetical protein